MDCGIQGSSLGAGIQDADFVFYVSAMETERCHKGLTVAYAAHCQQEAVLDRYDVPLIYSLGQPGQILPKCPV